jgi:hypothetical protein
MKAFSILRINNFSVLPYKPAEYFAHSYALLCHSLPPPSFCGVRTSGILTERAWQT